MIDATLALWALSFDLLDNALFSEKYIKTLKRSIIESKLLVIFCNNIIYDYFIINRESNFRFMIATLAECLFPQNSAVWRLKRKKRLSHRLISSELVLVDFSTR